MPCSRIARSGESRSLLFPSQLSLYGVGESADTVFSRSLATFFARWKTASGMTGVGSCLRSSSAVFATAYTVYAYADTATSQRLMGPRLRRSSCSRQRSRGIIPTKAAHTLPTDAVSGRSHRQGGRRKARTPDTGRRGVSRPSRTHCYFGGGDGSPFAQVDPQAHQ